MSKGYAIDVTTKNAIHYYIDGVSLCGRMRVKPFFDLRDIPEHYWHVNCTICKKKLEHIVTSENNDRKQQNQI